MLLYTTALDLSSVFSVNNNFFRYFPSPLRQFIQKNICGGQKGGLTKNTLLDESKFESNKPEGLKTLGYMILR